MSPLSPGVRKRINSLYSEIGHMLHERESWIVDEIDAEEERIAVIACFGGTTIAVGKTMPAEVVNYAQKIAADIAGQLGRQTNQSTIVGADGRPINLH